MILDDIQAALGQGRRTADSLGVAVSLAIVDAGGVLRAFEMMDGAEIAGETLAVDKAFTAVAHRMSTAQLGLLAQPGGELFGLQANGRGRFVLIGGGLPITHLGTTVGGVGVSGATSEQDVACAEAVAEALEARLRAR